METALVIAGEVVGVRSGITLVLCYGKPDGGSKWTMEFAHKHNRPWFHIHLNRPMDSEVREFIEWLKASCPENCVLNFAETRESKKLGIQKSASVWVLEILGKANGRCYYPPPIR